MQGLHDGVRAVAIDLTGCACGLEAAEGEAGAEDLARQAAQHAVPAHRHGENKSVVLTAGHHLRRGEQPEKILLAGRGYSKRKQF